MFANLFAAEEGAGHPVSIKVAMSMPGEREAQQMLRGQRVMSRAQSMMGGIPKPQQRQPTVPSQPAAPIKGIEQTPEPSVGEARCTSFQQ